MRHITAFIFAAFAALVVHSAPVPQASQAWVNMRLEQVKQEVFEYLDNIPMATNITQTQVIETATAMSIAGVSPVVDMLCEATYYSAPSNAAASYLISAAFGNATNYISGGTFLPMVNSHTFSTNNIVLEIGSATNTLMVLGTDFAIFAPSNSAIFAESNGDGWAVISKP